MIELVINYDGIAAVVAQAMVGRVDANRQSYLENSDFESVFESCFDMAVAPANLKGDLYTNTYLKIISHPEILLAFVTMKEIQREARIEAQDAIRLAENPGKYYGVSNADFV